MKKIQIFNTGKTLLNTSSRNMSTTASEISSNPVSTLAKKIEMPSWGLILAGIGGVGSLGKWLHDDMRDLREDMGKMESNLREDMRDIREDMRAVNQNLVNIATQIGAPSKALNNDSSTPSPKPR